MSLKLPSITMYQKSLFIFRRDLRISDNTALIAATEHSKIVILCFILDPRQVGDTNKYRSTPCVQFMINSLEDLSHQIFYRGGRLFLFHGIAEKVVAELLNKMAIDAVYVNRDYTPFALKRDAAIEATCKKHTCSFHAYDDVLLNAPAAIHKKNGSPYVKFTPFYRAALVMPIAQPRAMDNNNFFSGSVPGSYNSSETKKLYSLGEKPKIAAGRTGCLGILKNIASHKNYKECHDIPADDCTTHLSAHMKFTTCSPREVYYALREGLPNPELLMRQLYWRDFFTHIAYAFPHVFTSAFNPKYDEISWKYDQHAFTRWSEGTTGYPIVDAGMRQLSQTGWMHNRARLIVASFLTKDLHIDWRQGERFFATSLIDYDPAVNNGNWQWVAGSGCDAQPYFRIFNPWLQQKKFDPDCTYIKQWIPELRASTPATIHNWFQPKYRSFHHSYPAPMVDHAQAAQEALRMFRSIKKG